ERAEFGLELRIADAERVDLLRLRVRVDAVARDVREGQAQADLHARNRRERAHQIRLSEVLDDLEVTLLDTVVAISGRVGDARLHLDERVAVAEAETCIPRHLP